MMTGAPVKTAEAKRMVDLQKVFAIKAMCSSLQGHLWTQKAGRLLTAVIGKWEAFKSGSCSALDVRVIEQQKGN